MARGEEPSPDDNRSTRVLTQAVLARSHYYRETIEHDELTSFVVPHLRRALRHSLENPRVNEPSRCSRRS